MRRQLKNIIITAAAIGSILCAGTSTFAGSNAVGGGVVNTETFDLGPGPFDHGGDIGSSDNTIVSDIFFAGGFNATHIRFTGTANPVLPTSFGSEADIQVRQGLLFNNWQNPGPDEPFVTYNYDSTQELTGDFEGGIDPGGGKNWTIEFFEEFDDDEGGGPDTQSSDLQMIFEERMAVSDTNGMFSAGALSSGGSSADVGEFALPELFDLYSVTLSEPGLFSVATDEGLSGFVGTTLLDTEIGLFDAAGVLLAENDDIDAFSGNLYSGIFDLPLAAGEYTVAVAPYLGTAGSTSFDDGLEVNAGTGTGDYSISFGLISIPEPGSLALLGLACFGLVAHRRRWSRELTCSGDFPNRSEVAASELC